MPFVTRYAWNILRPAIDTADVIVEVLDARNPQGTRSSKIEKMVLDSTRKILVLVINKTDLVPSDVVHEWVRFLSHVAPVLTICAKYPSNIREFMGKLKGIIKDHPRWEGASLKMRVLVVGYPNSGKSTLIQALTENKKSVRSSSQAGFTRGVQKIKLSEKLYLIDTPGVIPPDESDEIGQALDTCSISPQKIIDHESVIDEIIRRAGMAALNAIYGVDAIDQMDFIEQLGHKRGFLARGGRVKEIEVFKLLIRDWQAGKIRYHYRHNPIHPDSNGTPGIPRG
ncbi:hypothetical protein GF325_16645 [Candidatus Bathyarchaeota archaeon]|nr:hypothetical protein [Candidatus Bathyarchaeota archaeon]